VRETDSPTPPGGSLYDGPAWLVDSSTRRYGGYVVRLALNDDATGYDLTVRLDPRRPVRTDGGTRGTDADDATGPVHVRASGLDASYVDRPTADLLREFLCRDATPSAGDP
jgi:hypothetical protein